MYYLHQQNKLYHMKKWNWKMYAAGVVVILVFSSWGFLVHRTLNQVVVYKLPKAMQPFFYKNMVYLVKNSVRPDQRRNTDSTEAPKHFIDFEAYGDSAAWKMPFAWPEAVSRYSKDSLLKYGYVPYWIMEMKGKLTNAFRKRDTDSILFYAADLGHYIGDAHVPLHTSINYDGQLTNQRGLHSLWESTIPELELNQYRLYNRHKATYLVKPEEAIWNGVRQAHLLVSDVFNQEREATKAFVDTTKYRIQKRNGREVKSYTTAFARAYSQRLRNTVNRQLLRAADLYADFIYTAWIDAGEPNLSQLLSNSYTKEEKEKLKKEIRAYRKNELIKKEWLIARQRGESSGGD